jgi:hypothetical protein
MKTLSHPQPLLLKWEGKQLPPPVLWEEGKSSPFQGRGFRRGVK